MISIWEKTEYLRRGQQLKRESKSACSPVVVYIKFQNYKSFALDLKLDPASMLNCKFELVPSGAPRVIWTFRVSKYILESIMRAGFLAFFLNAPSHPPSQL